MRLCLATALLAAVLRCAAAMPPCAVVRVDDASRVTDSIRGPWELKGQDAFFELIAIPGSDCYELVMLESPSPTVGFRQPKGRLKPLAQARKFDLELEVEPMEAGVAGGRTHKNSFIATFNPGWSTMTLHSYDRHRSLSVYRLFPYLFRVGFSKGTPRPNDIDGAVNLNFSTGAGEIEL